MPESLPSIVKHLLNDKKNELNPYLAPNTRNSRDERIWPGDCRDWDVAGRTEKYHTENLYHDEPWVTLLALYGLFGTLSPNSPVNPDRVEAANELLAGAFQQRSPTGTRPVFDQITGVHLEVVLPEVPTYRKYLREHVFSDLQNPYHPYFDRVQKLKKKLAVEKASFEGNTHLDALISGKSGDRHVHVFIEAKFLSDISKDITYVPVRNQIARNIDCAIELMLDKKSDLKGLHDFWFVLLTPGIFRTESYGGHVKSPLSDFMPERSRLYCYKMDDYLDPDKLRQDMPHHDKQLGGGQFCMDEWELISNRIGWLTFEEIVKAVDSHGTLETPLVDGFREFFRERQLLPE